MHVCVKKTKYFPCRHSYRVTQIAAESLKADYKEDIMGILCHEIFRIHYEGNITYELDHEAKRAFEKIYDKYNGLFNLKYSGMYTLNQLPVSVLNVLFKTHINIPIDPAELISQDTLSQMNSQESTQCSQEPGENSAVTVKTKAAELVGRTTTVLWIYCQGNVFFANYGIMSWEHNAGLSQ